MPPDRGIARSEPDARPRAALAFRPVLLGLAPVLAALIGCALILLAAGVDPLAYYGLVVRRGLLSPRGLQETITRAAPLLLLGAGLIVSFRAGLWNLGIDGQFLLGAVASAAAAPALAEATPVWLAVTLSMGLAMLAGSLWSLLPAMLRAYQGVNEIITTLMMNFLGLSLANLLVKLVFADPTTTVPITRTLPVPDRLPRLFGSTVDIGVALALLVLIGVHLAITGTAWGLRLRLLGASPRAAHHVGLRVARMTVGAIALSAALAGLAGAVVVLGTLGNVRAEWNPAYGLTIIPLVLLARLNGWAMIGYVVLFAMLSIGGESAAIRLGVPHAFELLLIGLLLFFLALVEHLDLRRRRRGA